MHSETPLVLRIPISPDISKIMQSQKPRLGGKPKSQAKATTQSASPLRTAEGTSWSGNVGHVSYKSHCYFSET